MRFTIKRKRQLCGCAVKLNVHTPVGTASLKAGDSTLIVCEGNYADIIVDQFTMYGVRQLNYRVLDGQTVNLRYSALTGQLLVEIN